MHYKSEESLTKEQFKRRFGVDKKTYKLMLEVVKAIFESEH